MDEPMLPPEAWSTDLAMDENDWSFLEKESKRSFSQDVRKEFEYVLNNYFIGKCFEVYKINPGVAKNDVNQIIHEIRRLHDILISLRVPEDDVDLINNNIEHNKNDNSEASENLENPEDNLFDELAEWGGGTAEDPFEGNRSERVLQLVKSKKWSIKDAALRLTVGGFIYSHYEEDPDKVLDNFCADLVGLIDCLADPFLVEERVTDETSNEEYIIRVPGKLRRGRKKDPDRKFFIRLLEIFSEDREGVKGPSNPITVEFENFVEAVQKVLKERFESTFSALSLKFYIYSRDTVRHKIRGTRH